MQQPSSLTRFACLASEMLSISARNSLIPCSDSEHKTFAANAVPSPHTPCVTKTSTRFHLRISHSCFLSSFLKKTISHAREDLLAVEISKESTHKISWTQYLVHSSKATSAQLVTPVEVVRCCSDLLVREQPEILQVEKPCFIRKQDSNPSQLWTTSPSNELVDET